MSTTPVPSRPITSTRRSRPPSCPDENELVLLADGVLAETRRASIDRHLDGCATCTRLVAELAGMAAPVRPVPARYRIVRQLGAGAMGVVWEAVDTHLDRRVALKFVRPAVVGTADASRADRELRTRLFREARALAQLRHPNVVTVYDVGEIRDAPHELFLALELVIGTDARTWRRAQPRTRDEVLAVWLRVAAGLAAVHAAGIVHRDVKPDNVLVADDGRVLLGDFGLATDERTTQHTLATAASLTATGAIVGTPLYMAHEQLLGEAASAKSDQYALCASMWEALTGERPFTGPTLGALAMAMLRGPRLPRRADPVLAVLARGLDPSPARRWPTVDAMIAALAVRPAARRTRGVWLALGTAAIAAACTAGILAWQATGDAPASEAERRLALVEATPTERPPARVVADVPPADQRSPRRSAAPTPSRVTQTEYERIYRRATDRLDFGDGGACVQLLDAARPPATMIEHAGVLRAKCIMKTGDCARGRVLLESTARAHHWDAARTAKMLEHADLTYCPLEAGPRTQWTERARYRLQIASSTGRSCASILAFIAHHGLELPDRREALMLEAACHANVGDCKAARAAQRKAFTFGIGDPARAAELAQVADDTFAATHRQRCP